MTKSITPKLDEVELIRRASGGDADAFGQLYMLHLDAIYRYVFYRVGQATEAEDLTEQVFLKAWEAIGRYKHQGHSFSSWLYRIAHNLVVDHYRAGKGGKDDGYLDEGVLTLADPGLNPEEMLAKEEEVRHLQEAIAHLPAEQQQMIILRFIEGLSHAEVAAIIGKSEGASRVIQHRALVALRDALGKEG